MIDYYVLIPGIILAAMFGLVIGSFLNVCIYRLPKKESLVTVPSHCMKCGTQLHWYELIPLFSWLALRGKCRTCKTPISPQYPIIEASNMVAYVLVILINGVNLTSCLYCLLASCLIVLSVIDARTQEIPIEINITIAVLGLIETVYVFIVNRSDIWNHVLGIFIPSLPMFLIVLIAYALFKVEVFGMGDIKLLAAAGFLIGWKNVLLAFFLGCIAGSIIHMIRMMTTKEDHVLAFGPYLAGGIFICALWGDAMIGWYLRLFM